MIGKRNEGEREGKTSSTIPGNMVYDCELLVISLCNMAYSAAQIYLNYAYAYYTLVFWVYVYVNTHVDVLLLCIPISFFI